MELEEFVSLAGLALKLGEVNRTTLHADGWQQETDTTHTVMLAWMAPALCARLKLPLDTGDVTEFAVVHDLLEAYTGDYPTLVWSPEQQAAKEKAESAALQRLVAEHGAAWPWLIWRVSAYESQLAPAARYVRSFDKILPKLTHFTNNYAQLLREGITPGQLAARLAQQYAQLEGWLYEPWFKPVLKMYLDVAVAAADGYNQRWLDVQQIRRPKLDKGQPLESPKEGRVVYLEMNGRPVAPEIKRLLGEAE